MNSIKNNYLNFRFISQKLFAITLIVASIALVSCGGKKEEVALAPGMMQLDLSPYGLPLNITIPDSSKGKIEVKENTSTGTVEIRVGKSFQIFLYESEGDIALAKSDIAGDEVKKFKKYVVDEPSTILYETQIMEADPEFHLYTVVKVGEKSYVVEDIKEEAFNEETAKMMLESAKSIKQKEVAAS